MSCGSPLYFFVSNYIENEKQKKIAYEYEITLKPKESIVNTVTAPMYPAINGQYDPAIYIYTYLLSPASTWAAFKEIEININTPFYMMENNIEGSTKTDNGYTYKR